MSNEIMNVNEETKVAAASMQEEEILGFEDMESEDIVIPRIKVINALSPERQDGIAAEGDIINSLTKDNLAGKKFIPIKIYYSKMKWNPDRDSDQRILCMSRDGKVGEDIDGNKKACTACSECKFNNALSGKDAQPTCTSYMNFLGFLEGDPMPIVLSFAKTNYNEGKKMLSIAKSLRCNIWDYSYLLEGELKTKGRNKWYNIKSTLSTETNAETRILARSLYDTYKTLVDVKVDYSDDLVEDNTVTDAEIAAEV